MFASNNNALLIDGCNNLQNLNVLLDVTEDVATTDGSGWTFQLNCYPPPGQYCQTSQVNIVQYVVYVQGGNLAYQIQYWAGGASTWPAGYTPQPNTTPWLPCWANDFYLSSSFAKISGDTLPRQSQLQINLATNANGGIYKATFTYTDPDGTNHSAHFDVPAALPIVACTLNLVGPGGGANANFTQGLLNSRGIIYYSVSSGTLSVQSGGAGSACGEGGYFTAETSNMSYGDITGAPGATVTQILQQPVPCSLSDIFSAHAAPLGEMSRLRDTRLVRHPAGKWISETFERHAADLAVIFSSDPELARRTRELLLHALRTATDNEEFDSQTIDAASAALKQAACKFPPSMIGVASAASTVLESLRGRTLDSGLEIASKTIRPRWHAPRPEPSGGNGKCCQRLLERIAELEQRIARLEGGNK